MTSTVAGFPSYTQLVDVVQTGTGLDFRDPGGGIIRFGAIDPATGAFDLPTLMPSLICQASSTGIDPLTGTASLDGGSLSGTGVISTTAANSCLGFGLTVTGTRCPGG